MKSTRLAFLALASLAAVLPVSAKDVVIIQKNREFSKPEVTVQPGDTIIFRNADEFAHNLFSLSPGSSIGNHMQAPGESIHVTLPAEGEIEVQCAIHPKMKLFVKVKK